MLQWIGDLSEPPRHAAVRTEGGGQHLIGGICRSCETVSFPTSSVCLGCGGSTIEPAPLPTTGVLYSWTRVHVSSARPVPYLLGYVDFEGDTRVLGELRLSDLEPAVGLKLVTVADENGNWWFESAGVSA